MGMFQAVIKSKFDFDTLMYRLTANSQIKDGIRNYDQILFSFTRHSPLRCFCRPYDEDDTNEHDLMESYGWKYGNNEDGQKLIEITDDVDGSIKEDGMHYYIIQDLNN